MDKLDQIDKKQIDQNKKRYDLDQEYNNQIRNK